MQDRIYKNNEDFETVAQSIKGSLLNVIDNHSKVKFHNHLENQWNLSNKKALFYNLYAYYSAVGKQPFDYIPLTFHIREGTNDPFY